MQLLRSRRRDQQSNRVNKGRKGGKFSSMSMWSNYGAC